MHSSCWKTYCTITKCHLHVYCILYHDLWVISAKLKSLDKISSCSNFFLPDVKQSLFSWTKDICLWVCDCLSPSASVVMD